MNEIFKCKVVVDRKERPTFLIDALSVNGAVEKVLEIINEPIPSRKGGPHRFSISVFGTKSAKAMTRYF